MCKWCLFLHVRLMKLRSDEVNQVIFLEHRSPNFNKSLFSGPLLAVDL